MTNTSSCRIAVLILILVCATHLRAQEQAATTVSGGVLNGKAVSLPVPPYPAAARAVQASGQVVVQVLIDEDGSVISATAVSGHPLLRGPAADAAKNATFSPTLLGGKPVKVTGVITYTFNSNSTKGGDYLSWIGAGLTLGALQEVGADPGLELSAAENGKSLPEMFSEEKRQLAELPNVAGARQTEIIDTVITSIEGKLSGDESWQFEIGKRLGHILGQLKQYTVNRDAKFDESAFMLTMEKIAELANNAPNYIPTEVSNKFKEFAAWKDRNDLSLPDRLVHTLQSGSELIQFLMSKKNVNR
jgi:TonB family protein